MQFSIPRILIFVLHSAALKKWRFSTQADSVHSAWKTSQKIWLAVSGHYWKLAICKRQVYVWFPRRRFGNQLYYIFILYYLTTLSIACLYNVESFVEKLLINWKGCRRQRCCNSANLLITNISSAKIHFSIIRRPAVNVNCLVGINILLDNQCGFRRNRLTTGHVFVLCVRKILEKNGKM